MRTIIELPKIYLNAISEICDREKISRAEAIRRAVGQYLRQKKPVPQKDVFGLWKGRKINALDFEDEKRSEWEPGESSH